MAKHICIRIYDDGTVKLTKEQEKDEVPGDSNINIGGKNLTFACWYKENPTCVIYNGKKY
jgi:hypothetical protein